jgi:hypothetical protein
LKFLFSGEKSTEHRCRRQRLGVRTMTDQTQTIEVLKPFPNSQSMIQDETATGKRSKTGKQCVGQSNNE